MKDGVGTASAVGGAGGPQRLRRAAHAGGGAEFTVAGHCRAVLIPAAQELVGTGSEAPAARSPELPPRAGRSTQHPLPAVPSEPRWPQPRVTAKAPGERQSLTPSQQQMAPWVGKAQDDPSAFRENLPLFLKKKNKLDFKEILLQCIIFGLPEESFQSWDFKRKE